MTKRVRADPPVCVLQASRGGAEEQEVAVRAALDILRESIAAEIGERARQLARFEFERETKKAEAAVWRSRLLVVDGLLKEMEDCYGDEDAGRESSRLEAVRLRCQEAVETLDDEIDRLKEAASEIKTVMDGALMGDKSFVPSWCRLYSLMENLESVRRSRDKRARGENGFFFS